MQLCAHICQVGFYWNGWIESRKKCRTITQIFMTFRWHHDHPRPGRQGYEAQVFTSVSWTRFLMDDWIVHSTRDTCCSWHLDSNSGQVVYLCRLRSTQLFIVNWWISRVPAIRSARVRPGDAASAGWQVTLCDPIWHAGFYSGVGAILLYLYFLPLTSAQQ